MAEASTEKQNFARPIVEGTLQSLNLKSENNLNEYIILIVGNHDEGNLFENVSMISGEDRVKAFGDIEESLRFIDSWQDKNIFLIISGTLGETYAHQFDTRPQIICVYVYCMDKDKHAIWAEKSQKIRCTVSDSTQLLTRLHADIKQLISRWPFADKSFQKAKTFTSEWYHLFLLAISHQPPCIQKSYYEMLQESRIYYKKNPYMLRQIDNFEKKCNSYNAIQEYTRDTFLYRITNRALRTQNMEIIQKFSRFITDLHSKLHENYRQFYNSKICTMRAVYRGQHLSNDELEYLRSICKSTNPVIKFTTFCSTSRNPQIAMDFIPSSDDRIPCLFEIIITDEYKIEESDAWDVTQTFADIASLSNSSNEQEVLFSLLTHFRVVDVGDRKVQHDRPWIPITLELINAKMKNYTYSYIHFIKLIQKEKNPQHYTDILNVLKEIIKDEAKFNNLNWNRWWSIFAKQWGTDAARDQPLLLTFYQCFTEHKYYLRTAVEMHKYILRSIPSVESNRSSYSYLLKEFKCWQLIPTKAIAVYEEYLKNLCTTNKKEYVNCLCDAGEAYEKICDKERALECYETVLALDESNKFPNYVNIQKRIKKLKKSSETDRLVNDERISRTHMNINRSKADKPSIESRLQRLLQHLEAREKWYDAADSKIILRLPYENIPDLSVKDYRSYFLSAVETHISWSIIESDAANNVSLCRWRYEKYMHEWTLFKALEKFLQPFKKKSEYIINGILPRLERFLKKLSVLITICIVYICIDPGSGKINVNKLQSINLKNTETRQLIFFDLRDGDLLRDLEALNEKSSATPSARTDLSVLEY